MWSYAIYIITLTLSCLIIAALGIYSWHKRAQTVARCFMGLLATLFIWTLMTLLEFSSDVLSIRVFWADLAHLGIAFSPLAWLALVMVYTGNTRHLKRTTPLLGLVPLLTNIMIWTNDAHHLWRAHPAELRMIGPLFITIDYYGKWFNWVHIPTSGLMFTLSFVVLAWAWWHKATIYRKQINILMLSILMPLCTHGLYVTHITPNFNFTPIVFSISGLILTWNLFQYHFLDFVPIVREKIIENIHDSIIVVDKNERVAYANAGAQILFAYPISQIIGKPLKYVLHTKLDMLMQAETDKEHSLQLTIGEGEERQWYDVQITLLHGYRQTITGRLIMMHNITARIQSEKEHREIRENAERIRKQTQQLAQRMAILADAGRKMSASLQPTPIFKRLTHLGKWLLDAQSLGLYVRDSDSDTFHPYLTEGAYAEALKNFTFDIGKGLLGHFAEIGRADIVKNPAEDVRAIPIPGIPKDAHSALLIAPLIVNGRTIGVLALWRAQEMATFTTSDLNFVLTLIRQATTALENAQLFEETRQAREVAEQARIVAETARAHAEAANRAKSIFLANMSHELRTPLNAILGFSELMTRSNSLTPEQQDNLATIGRSGSHLLALINDILELSKIEAGRIDLQTESFDLYQMLLGLKEMFSLRAEQKGLELKVERAANVPRYIHADASKLRQVLINLLGNAVKFTKVGHITLRIQAHPFSKNQACLDFEIEDTGIGIAEDELDKVFDAFVQTSSGQQSQQGTGLGMPISSQYIDMMGGHIRVRSELGKGSCFQFDIAVNVVPAEEVITHTESLRVVGLEEGQPTPRVLIVDDVAASRKLLVMLLQPLGIEVREAENGARAIEVWETWHPHLIFMDIRMPVMDGWETTRRIKKAMRRIKETLRHIKETSSKKQEANQSTVAGQFPPHTIIVALTASAFEEDKDEALAWGHDDFLRKPFRESEIFAVLEKHLHISFIYEACAPSPTNECFVPQTACQETAENACKLVTARDLSTEWLAAMQQASHDGDLAWLERLITQIKPDYPAFSEHLSQLAYNYQHNEILVLLEQL